MIREITGKGDGNGPFISIHDGFQGVATWAGFLPNSDRIALDYHPYFAFDGSPNSDPIGVDGQGGQWPTRACGLGSPMNTR
jgi:glucan 1,3-beta-glucosidase